MTSATTTDIAHRPLCECHGEPMSRAGRDLVGAQKWLCRVQTSAYRRDFAAANPTYRDATKPKADGLNWPSEWFRAAGDEPLCKCHDKPMRWEKPDKWHPHGTFVCRDRHNERRRIRYQSDPQYRAKKLKANSSNSKQRTCQSCGARTRRVFFCADCSVSLDRLETRPDCPCHQEPMRRAVADGAVYWRCGVRVRQRDQEIWHRADGRYIRRRKKELAAARTQILERLDQLHREANEC